MPPEGDGKLRKSDRKTGEKHGKDRASMLRQGLAAGGDLQPGKSRNLKKNTGKPQNGIRKKAKASMLRRRLAAEDKLSPEQEGNPRKSIENQGQCCAGGRPERVTCHREAAGTG